jgi:hypothetical protein
MKKDRLAIRILILVFISIPLIYWMAHSNMNATHAQTEQQTSTQTNKIAQEGKNVQTEQEIPDLKDEVGQKRKTVNFDKAAVKEFLMTKEHWSESNANWETSVALPVIDARLQPVLDAYLADKTIDSNFNVQGVTIKFVMDRCNINFWRALQHMDDYLMHPEHLKGVTNPNYDPARYFDVKPADATDDLKGERK